MRLTFEFLTVLLAAWLIVITQAACSQPTAPSDWMQQAVEAGSFVKIGSVLVARDGKVVDEHYFGGDASTLRDTRSATRAI